MVMRNQDFWEEAHSIAAFYLILILPIEGDRDRNRYYIGVRTRHNTVLYTVNY